MIIVKTHHNKMATMLMIAVLALLFLNNVVCSQKPEGGYNHVRPMRQGDALWRYRKQARSKPTAFGATTDSKFSLENVALRTEGSSDQVGKKEKDKITKLPGQPDVNFKQYGGYVTVDEESGRALFYYFVEAPGAYATTMPLLLWLNGGPGCSSLAYGAMEELGPFRVHSDGKTLYRNPYSWNKVANVLFLESPAGVGFSYSNTTSDYQMSGDSRTAEDAYVFLVNWLKRFPEYENRDFYMAGESYAGHYVPQLAHVIHQFNQLPKANTINLRGIIIGNGVINDGTDDKGMFDYVWTHALISDEEIANVNKNCDFSKGTDTSEKCNNASSVYQDVTYEIDIYNIYGPICMSTNLTDRPTRPRIKNFDPCHGYYVINYLNIPQVQEALHANVTKKVEGPWSPCSSLPWQDQDKTVLPLLKEFISSGIRVWIFSGDVDGRVPVTSTKYSLNAMNLTVATPWTAWYANKEVGGYSLVYKGNLTFATVRGAGHEVPSYQPYRAFVLAKHFLDGKPLPTS